MFYNNIGNNFNYNSNFFDYNKNSKNKPNFKNQLHIKILNENNQQEMRNIGVIAEQFRELSYNLKQLALNENQHQIAEQLDLSSNVFGDIAEELSTENLNGINVFLVLDSRNQVQGIAVLYKEDRKHYSLDKIAVASWNIRGVEQLNSAVELSSQNPPIKGIGTLLIQEVVNNVLSKNPDSELTAVSADLSIDFYKKLGFVSDLSDPNIVKLSKSASEIYLQQLRKKMSS